MGFHRSLSQVMCLLLVVFGVIFPFILLRAAIRVDGDATGTEETLLRSLSTHERKPLDYLPESREASELRQQIRELEEIRSSVRDELRTFEQQRTKLSGDIDSHKDSLARVKRELSATQKELQEKKGRLSKTNRDLYDQNPPPAPVVNVAPIIILPADDRDRTPPSLPDAPQRLPRGGENTVTDAQFAGCSYELCFQYARCPLTRSFSVYVYNKANPYLFQSHLNPLLAEFVTGLKESGSFTDDPDAACLYVVVMESLSSETPQDVETRLRSLSHWKGEGENHVLIELSTSRDGTSALDGVRTGRAIVARSFLSSLKPFRNGYDLLLPPLPTSEVGWRDLPQLLPVSRPNLIYFHGDAPRDPTPGSLQAGHLKSLHQALEGVESVDIQLQCPGSDTGMEEKARDGEWALCGGQGSRLQLCSRSTFSLVPSPGRATGNGIGTATYTRLTESLMCGSVPVLIGTETLPFGEVLDWHRAAVVIPSGRFSEIHYILRSIDRDSLLDLRLRGRHLWLTYFSSPLAMVQSVVAVVRSHTLHPPPTAPDFTGASLYSNATTSMRRRLLSPTLTQNFTAYSWRLWNDPPGPFFSYPTTPFTPGPISGSQYSELDERSVSLLPIHILDGGGVTGPVFEDLLLGNTPEEQFTVVMLTYQRNHVLVEAIGRMKKVRFLNKVVVVWNNEEDPPRDLRWPDIGVPVEVVRGKGNSLNNRFLPFREIETEAVLSIDDDVQLREDEIEFAFRVWREARERIVGFPGRFHAYDVKHQSWMYNSNYTCELSMVLTGAAFFHKIYSYLYSYWQPPQVREMVDQYMNCEDIAMNFLVSHITRKPPLKATSRWTFRCPTCPETLSTDDTHFMERHVCMKLLTSLYGYIPLLYTQFRVDSVLFKTRLPSELEKCYEYI